MLRLTGTTTSGSTDGSTGGTGGTGGTGDTGGGGAGFGILIFDASDNSSQLSDFLDLIENPCDYRGKVVYLTSIGPTPRPDPFLWADKFYFNEGCEWHESPFSFKLDE